MHRIDTPTAQKDKFGQGKNGFTNGDPTTGTPSTGLDEAMFDALQEEVCTVVERSGIKLNKDQHDQLYQAIRKLSKEDLSKALLKAQNLADLPDKGAARSHLEVYSQSQTDGKYLPKTGGTVNGPLTVEGNAKFTGTDYLDKSGVITDKKNTVRETNGLRIRGIEGQRADLRYWEKIGQGASLKLNVISGKSNGEFNFRQNGEFRASGGATFGGNITVSWGGRSAIFHESGDVTGPVWGGTLSHWLNQNCVLNVQLGARQVNPGFSGRFDTPGGCVMTSAHGDSDNWISAQYAPIQIWKNNQWVTIAG